MDPTKKSTCVKAQNNTYQYVNQMYYGSVK